MQHTEHHNHNHNHHHITPGTNLNRAFQSGIVLNLIYVIVEAAYGFYYNSMGLLSDAGHNLSDVASLLIAMVAFRMSQRRPTGQYTYGYSKMTIQASLVNSVLLLVAVGAILVESISKLLHPATVNGEAIAWVSGVGVIINGITAWFFMRDKDKDLNVKGAFMHMIADALVSVGVVVSGIIIHFTGWYVIDPVIGILIAIILGLSTKSLLLESFRMSIDAVPHGIDYDSVTGIISSVEGVKDVHHLHIWPLSTTITALTTHVIIDNPNNLDRIIDDIRHQLQKIGITHSTIQTETRESSTQHTESDI